MIKRRKVVIIQRVLPHYRRRFFELLREQLARNDTDLILIYGSPASDEAHQGDIGEVAWGHRIENKRVNLGAVSLYWQPCLRFLEGADLIIVEQASKLLLNYYLFLRQLLGLDRLCLWGHGKNFQMHDANPIGEGIKRHISRKAHWWFAYNDLSAATVKSLGYPEHRITSVQNAIDTLGLMEARQKITPAQLERIRDEAGIKGNNVCLFTGGMYAAKRLDFLTEACLRIREKIPDFEMLFIGAGPESAGVRMAAEQYGWIHYLGPRFDEARVPFFMLAKLSLMPGIVGLAVLDSFALETPLVTTNVPYHSPEIDYLADGVNGIIVQDSDDLGAYASRVVHLLQNDEARLKLVEGCRRARGNYTIEGMAANFSAGIMRALDC
ncbi:MAG: glycosyltransferase family 4 protein [Syntrophales bacterium]